MKKLKIGNYYCGLGGNRKLWGNEHDITAIELDPEIARLYKESFPNDTVIIGDAHEHLLQNFRNYDFIWGSPPCPDNSKAKFWGHQNTPYYPDLRLYQEYILLDNWFKGKFLIENVDPYYDTLIPGKKIGRHIFWSNFNIGNPAFKEADIKNGNIKEWSDLHGFDISTYKGNQRKDKILRNCVHPETGLYILNCARNIITKSNVNQLDAFIDS
jgi:DNA (cytosine-5)-methyltransferase 1